MQVRKNMTEILLKVTTAQIEAICREEHQRHVKKLKGIVVNWTVSQKLVNQNQLLWDIFIYKLLNAVLHRRLSYFCCVRLLTG